MESSDFPGSRPRCPAHADTQWTGLSPRRALIDGRVVTLIPSAVCEGRRACHTVRSDTAVTVPRIMRTADALASVKSLPISFPKQS